MKQTRTWPRRVLSATLSTALLLGGALAADWPQFLGEEDSQGVVDAQTPQSGAQLALRWQLATSAEGSNGMQGWTDVPGTPIVVDGYVYVYSSQYLRKLDLTTGEEVAKVKIYGVPVNQFFCNIAYGEGKLFVPCQTDNLDPDNVVKGCFIRVFDAETLQPLYVTEKIPGGQMQSPIMYHDGYLVTGTYGRNNVYVGFSAADEDPASGEEVKTAAWTVESGNKYGFSFNGAGFHDDYCYFTSGSSLFVVNYQSGASQTYDLGEGYTSHSTVTYSEETDRLYVASNNPEGGASVFSFALGADGMPVRESAKEWKSGTEGGGTQAAPVVYRGRLYLGGGGGTMGSAEPFHVIDAASMTELYSVPVQSKGTAAVSTAYATAENGWQVYIYMVPYAPLEENGEKQSQLWIIRDAQGQTKADYEVIDQVGRGQYCSQSVLIAEDGALLWYNDAAALYCYENTQAQPEVFRDIRGHEAKEDILYLYEKGIVNGTGDGRFQPNGTLSRAEFVQMLAKLSGATLTAPQTQEFDDVKPTDWYAPAVSWAAATGLTTGTGNGCFSPTKTLSRQEVLIFAARYVENIAQLTLPQVQEAVDFADQSAVASYAVESVKKAQQWGLTANDGAAFEPTEAATRAMAASVMAALSRAIQ